MCFWQHTRRKKKSTSLVQESNEENNVKELQQPNEMNRNNHKTIHIDHGLPKFIVPKQKITENLCPIISSLRINGPIKLLPC